MIDQKDIVNQPKSSQKEIDDFNAKYENDSNHKNDSTFTKLHFAAMTNSKEMLEILLSKGEVINAKNIIYLIIRILFLIKKISNK